MFEKKTRRLIFSLALGVLSYTGTSAQPLVRQADRHYEQMAYAQAIPLYEQALSRSFLTESERDNLLEKLGASYRKVQDTEGAERVYRQLLADKPADKANAQLYLYYAQALAANGRYDESRKAYEQYGTLAGNEQVGKGFTRLYADVSVLTRNAGSYRVDFLDFNTPKSEFSPVYFRDAVVFVSNRREGNGLRRVFSWNNTPFLDLFQMPEKGLNAEKTAHVGGARERKAAHGGRLMRPLGADDYTPGTSNDTPTVGARATDGESPDYVHERPDAARRFSNSLNSRYHEGPVAFTRDFAKIYFTRNNYLNGEYGKSKEGINKLKIYVARAEGSGWTEEKELSFNSDEYSCGHPTLGPDDKLMIFVSDMPGGQGGTDLYLTRYTKGRWSKPVNLGPAVNSKGNEMFPYLDELGHLYFSSDGHPGLGGLDLFYTPLNAEGVPGKIYNLGAPLNSQKDDFGIITDGQRKSGFFSSNRRNGGADDDIYRFQRDGALYPCRELALAVIDAESKQPLPNAKVDLNDKLTAADPKTLVMDSTGLARICLDPDTEFVLAASADSYEPGLLGFSTHDLADDKPIRIEIPLRKAKPKTTVLRGRILAQKDGKPLGGVRVHLTSDCDTTQRDTLSAEDGSYAFVVSPDCRYQVEASQKNRATIGGKTDTTGNAATDIIMFTKGDVVKIDNIYYDLSKWTIRPDAAAELDKLASLMKKYPGMRIELRSHTDSRSSTKANKLLSTRRALAAVSYLRKQGIDGKRMVAAGYGESQLLNGCRDGVNCPEEEHQQNRRTEFKILSLE